MSITIKNINIKSLGLLRDTNFNLSNLNVFYGLNETGKTLITEFLLTSIFKNKQAFKGSLREINAEGKITVEGLEEKEVNFTLKNKKHIEDFLIDYNFHLPDIARLAVVRGADTVIDKNKEGEIDDSIIRRLLSKAEVFNKIKEKIPKTVQEASIKGASVVFDIKMGEVKNLEELDRKVKNIKDVLKEVEESYGGGEKALIDIEIKKLEAEKNKQLLSKRHLSFLLSKEIDYLKKKEEKVEDNKLEELAKRIDKYFYQKEELLGEVEEEDAYKKQADNYKWLREVKDLYYKYSKETVVDVKNTTPLLSFLSLFSLGVAMLFQYTLLSYIFFSITTILFVFYFYQINKFLKKKIISKRYSDLKKEFSDKTNSNLTETNLLLKHNETENSYNNYIKIKEKRKERESIIKLLKKEVQDLFDNLGEEEIKEEEWREILEKIRKEKNKIVKKISERERQLFQLNVDKEDYHREEVDEEYNEEKLLQIEKCIKEKLEEKKEIESKLNNLKQKICNITGNEITDDWNIVIDNINNKLTETEEEEKDKRAEIIAKKFVFDAVENLEKAEDEKIEERLSSSYIKDLIKQLTDNNYQDIYLQDKKVFLSSSYQDFSVRELSTGTVEQVMLALRLGFLKEIMGGRDMFLILDDAFQHSDWKRRERMVKKLAELSINGPQIIYFTMDDHILGLFNKYGKDLKDNYRRFTLK